MPKRKPELYFGPGHDPFPSGGSWTVRRVSMHQSEDDGYCDPNSHTIFLAKGLSKRDLVETALHEGLHAEFYDLSEMAVNRAAKHLTALLEYLCVV